MSLAETLLLAVALSIDACTVALASTAAGVIKDRRAAFRLSFHFGIFQFLMPVVGWSAGTQLVPLVAAFDHWIAFGLLAFVGVRMMRSAEDGLNPAELVDPTRGWVLVTLATATSIDALAVGLGLAALRISVWYPSVIIGAVTMAMSILAILGGKKVGRWLGAKAQLVGGIVLILIGLRILASHML
jgi:manganese efflux pump family protein